MHNDNDARPAQWREPQIEDSAQVWAVEWDMPSYDDQRATRAFQTLKARYVSALIVDPHQPVPTPAHVEPSARVVDLVLRELNGPRGVELLCAFMRLAAHSMSGYNLVTWMAGDYAARHWRAYLQTQDDSACAMEGADGDAD